MTAEHARPGRFVWHDLMTTDAARSVAFYTGLFDWRIEERDVMGHCYREIHCGPGQIGGVIEEKGIPMSHWMPYVAVEDVDRAAAKITEHGGGVCVPPTDIPDTGRFAVVNDPQGAWFSIYRGTEGKYGADPDVPVPGRVCWNECLTTDDEKAQEFYTAVFGWQDEPTDMGPAGTYHVQKAGGKEAAGIMKNPQDGAPSCWLVYFLVEDLGAATGRARELGAAVMMENQPIPNVGAFSLIQDPVGAVVALFQASPQLGAGS